ncbi:glycerophosphodiester phosphodiesterase family protein [Lacticaseibacillus baoqingensis]|uniref:Glycerophosphodiester phosphodiesterase family protein n=1 Tax=Lacticaseibacillus baoqingensis TaxID=2486013 RepID=A0ABW4E5F5_9LACO|nr:glycerophosphodiester phosphodiesterase family protein [Lacticaseibacillus baoqingensis]
MNRRILAHRGLSHLAPENTLAAFTLAVNMGVDWLETDLGITQDEHVVILHDDHLDRTTNGHGLLTTQTYAQLRRLSAGAWFDPRFASERVPNLQELVAFLNRTGMNANIELKSVVADNANVLADSLVRQFAKALDAISPNCEIIVSSKNPVMLLKLRQLRPQTHFAVLFDRYSLRDDWQLTMQACGAEYIHPQAAQLTYAQVSAFKRAGYQVNVWTIDARDLGNQLFNWGVDGIFSNCANEFLTEKRSLPHLAPLAMAHQH